MLAHPYENDIMLFGHDRTLIFFFFFLNIFIIARRKGQEQDPGRRRGHLDPSRQVVD